MKRIIAIYMLLLAGSLSFVLQAQNTQNTQSTQEVKGTVYDEFGETLPGAAVYLQDRPGVGVQTDLDGNFQLKASRGDVLVVSFLGYKEYKHLIDGTGTQLVVKLQPNDMEIEEVVVTGMGGSQRKISLVGAVTTVDPKDLQSPAASIANVLGGRVAGIITQQSSGEPGKNIAEFWVRGIGTFGANQSALVLIDGLEGNLNQIDPADIENFTILKDASATAVYGVRGANGVILVTTKRGTSDKLNITARANFTISQLKRMPKYLKAYEYAKLANEAKVVRGDLPLYSDIELDLIQDRLDPDLYPDVNWRDEIMKKSSFRQSYYASARGGGSLARYFLSLGYTNEGSAYKQDPTSKYNSNVSFQKFNYRSNIDINLTTSTLLYFGLDGYYENLSGPGMGDTNQLWDAQASLTPLTIPTMYSSGEYPAYGPNADYSPYIALNHTGKGVTEVNDNQVTLALEQDLNFLLKGLRFRAQGALKQYSYYREINYLRPEMYYATGRYATGELMLVKKLEEITASYGNHYDLERKLHFESTINYETIVNRDHRISALVYYYMSGEKKTRDIRESSLIKTLAAIPRRYQGVSSQIRYGFRDTYLLDVNFGYTGSENFEPGKQFGFFPSIAGGWIPTGYEFVREKVPFIDFLKFRASYGLVGNDRISDTRFPYLTILEHNAGLNWSSSSWGTLSGGGLKEQMIGADNLQWEKAKKFNIGVDGRLFNDAVDFTVDYFVDRRDGIFQQRAQIPDYVGLVNMPYGNVGQMKSWGADGNISYSHTVNKDMYFIVRGNFTYSTNNIENWEQAFSKYPYQEWSGWPYRIQRGYIAEGLFRDEADIANSPKQTFGNYLPGDIKYKDVNGDGIINDDDEIPLTFDNYPRVMYGFGGEFGYKNLTIGFLFKGIGKKDFFYMAQSDDHQGGFGYYPFLFGQTGNILEIVADQRNRWTPASYSKDPSTENPNARFPRLSYGGSGNNTRVSTFWRANGQYLRLQEISINYKLRTPYFKKLGVSSIDLQLIGSDLYVWDKIGGLWDPEQTAKNGRAYPIPATYALQMYINF